MSALPNQAGPRNVASGSRTGEVMLEVEDLSVRFGALLAVNGVSFQALRGHITSVIGPNGAGKSSLFNLISGAIPPSQGHVRLQGREVTGAPPHQMLAAGLARSFQITNLFFDLSVRENLRLASQYIESWRYLLQPVAASRRAIARSDELIEQFALAAKADELAGYLSHGEQRRLEIALSLATRPSVLLLDEPTQGMSHAEAQETAALIQGLVQSEGLTILLVEHDVDLVMNLSDHVVVMHQGQKLAEGSPQSVRANLAVQAAYFGEQVHA